MRLKTFILAAIATTALATPAAAGLNIAVSSTSDLNAIGVGETFTLDIDLTTDTAGEARGLTLRVADIDDTVLGFDSATIPNFGGAATPTGAVFGLDLGGGIVINALTNALAGPVDNGTDVVLFNGVTTGATTSAGPETFTLTLEALAAGTVTLEIGAISSFGDAYVSSVDGTSAPTTTTTVTVPEPGSVAASLAALGSVFGVVTIRRRQDG